jgi:molecular chaperone GrpE
MMHNQHAPRRVLLLASRCHHQRLLRNDGGSTMIFHHPRTIIIHSLSFPHQPQQRQRQRHTATTTTTVRNNIRYATFNATTTSKNWTAQSLLLSHQANRATRPSSLSLFPSSLYAGMDDHSCKAFIRSMNHSSTTSSSSSSSSSSSTTDSTVKVDDHEIDPTTTSVLNDMENENVVRSEDEANQQQQQQQQQKQPMPEHELNMMMIAELQQQNKEIKDQLLRSLAEQENTRRIAVRDVQQARDYSIKSFAKSLLDVADNLARAMEAVPIQYRTSSTSSNDSSDSGDSINTDATVVLQNLYQGIEMTEHGLKKVLESHGVVSYGTRGDSFDPNLHEALFEYPDDTAIPGTIGQVMKIGYKLNDRVLRPAEVGVVKKPAVENM